MDSDLPIALRRTRRSTAGPRAVNGPSERSSTAKSPHKAKRRVRFSDPGPILTHASASSSSSSSTGLTPMIRRTSLARGVTPAKRRRSTPARTTASGSGLGPAASSPLACEVHFEPLRQVLDGRVQRRLRRNGLSEEMNAIHDEKKAVARAADAEIARLRAELREKDAEIYQLQNATIVLDTDRIWALEKELDDLKDQLDNKTVENSRTYAWTLAAKDPFADDCMDSLTDDDDRFGDVTMAELACSTPTRARTSFPTPPLTSPALPKTPSAWRAGVVQPPTPDSRDTGVQVSLLDPAKQYLEDQVDSMRREMLKLTATLESYTALTSRLTCRLSAFSPPESPATPADQSTHHEPPATPTDHPLEAQLAHLLRTTADRSAALITLTSSISSLGFPGSDAAEIVASLSSAFRTARLELEYLTPGEIALPLSAHGAEVLDLLLTRLRALATKAREADDLVDEYHEQELSLRKQLAARVEAMDQLAAELAAAQTALADADDLRVGNERLRGAAEGYRRDMAELETLVERVDGERAEAVEAKTAQEEAVSALEARLAAAVDEMEALSDRVEAVTAAKAREVAALNRQAGKALAVRDARVAELREEVERVNGALRGAYETIKDLRVDKAGVERDLAREKERAEGVIDAMRAELERVVSASREMLSQQPAEGGDGEAQGVLSSPLKGGVDGRRGSLLSGDLARRASGRKRRRHDSGMGLLDEDEVDI
ncbi:hypothetical protein HYQ45_001203 [Verticillium longisporum]|uniref:Uncharacterized protein n=1 Tax=Verticillium longisporum TaxID=100787 RepID=A0A8I3A1K7_VERLO|nr:hypothetical protein HYQ45_001203 [Verticillium longisporum]